MTLISHNRCFCYALSLLELQQLRYLYSTKFSTSTWLPVQVPVSSTTTVCVSLYRRHIHFMYPPVSHDANKSGV